MRMQQRVLSLVLLVAMLVSWLPGFAHAQAAGAAGRYPVIVVPGIAGTELYDGSELVWLNTWRLLGRQVPILNLLQMNWLLPLRLKADGATPYNERFQIQVGDIMRRNVTNIYGGLLNSLRQEGYAEGRDLFVFPYDWRRELTNSADQLGAEVDRVLAATGARQVVLISHSMGGLIARDYVVRGGAPKVKATISLATPWLGAPMAYRALEYGWDLGLKLPGTKWSALAPKDVKLLTQNFPSVYELAPSRQYFALYPEGYLSRAGHSLTFNEAVVQGLAPHNGALSGRLAGYYDRLLDGSNHGVLQFVVAGKGRATLGAISERRDWLGLPQKTERTTDGDEVVPLLSADLGYSRDPRLTGSFIGKVEAVAYAGGTHTFFAQSPEVQSLVQNWIDTLNNR